MSFLKAGFSAINKFLIVIALAGTFLVGMFGTVYLALRGEELKVPEIVGKDYLESEKELAAMGLKIKRRADRFSQEKPNTVLEQLPRAGDTVKSGQMILVVVSKVNPDGTEAPATVQKDTVTTDDSVIDTPDEDKNKKTNKNSNVKRPTQTTRDVVSNKGNKNTSSNITSGDSNSATPKNSNSATPNNSSNKNPNPVNKSTPTPSNSPKPTATKSPVTSGETRTRKVP